MIVIILPHDSGVNARTTSYYTSFPARVGWGKWDCISGDLAIFRSAGNGYQVAVCHIHHSASLSFGFWIQSKSWTKMSLHRFGRATRRDPFGLILKRRKKGYQFWVWRFHFRFEVYTVQVHMSIFFHILLRHIKVSAYNLDVFLFVRPEHRHTHIKMCFQTWFCIEFRLNFTFALILHVCLNGFAKSNNNEQTLAAFLVQGQTDNSTRSVLFHLYREANHTRSQCSGVEADFLLNVRLSNLFHFCIPKNMKNFNKMMNLQSKFNDQHIFSEKKKVGVPRDGRIAEDEKVSVNLAKISCHTLIAEVHTHTHSLTHTHKFRGTQ